MVAKAIEIKNLAQFKRAIQEGHPFEIVTHYIHPECTGQIRKPTKIQTNSFYSTVMDDPDNRVSTANNGLGFWFEYGKAADWLFENGLCRRFLSSSKGRCAIWDIRVLDI